MKSNTNKREITVLKIVEIDGSQMQIYVTPAFAIKINRLSDNAHVAKINHLLYELREQLLCITCNVEDFPETEWLTLEECDRI
jgi:hypothetical protein